MLPDFAGAAQVRCRFISASGLNALNVFHVKQADADPYDAGQLGALALLVASRWTDDLGPVVSSQVYLADVTCTDLGSPDGAQVKSAVNVQGTGPATEAALLPLQTAALINWSTESRGKSARGKTYLCGFAEADSAGGQVGGTVLTAANLWAGNLIDDLATFGTELIIASYYTGGDKNADPPTPSTLRIAPIGYPVIAGACDFNWKTQRRRALAG